ncbi:hypothetical protein [Myxosarcina sp. GI1]|uniref:hypothetical protein n=1 Tax=Myxosarcina sp. GI1 TaxID=1541065 RepID=UPI000565665C|nr:hypothetical protein [Myxosarcina sp. GI1]
MLIYVQSRGISQENGYCWLDVQKNKISVKKPKLSVKFSNGINLKLDDLIDTQKFSIVLVNSQKNYYLYITGLKARKERADFMGRQVLNSLLWIAKITDKNEQKIRSIVIKALRGSLRDEIDKIINPGGEYEFQIDYEKLIQLPDLNILKTNQVTENKWKINNNSVDSQKDLADELTNKALPNKEGLSILLTSIKSAFALKELDVWRALSNRVESEESEKDEDNSIAVINRQAQKKTVVLGMVIVLILVIAIAAIIRLAHPKQSQPQINLSPKIEKSISSPSQNPFQNSLKMDSSSTELPPLTCQIAKEENLFLSPCFLNNTNN